MPADLPHTRLDDVVPPPLIDRLAEGRPVRPVWRNELGGVTYAIGEDAEYVKYCPAHPEFDPPGEFERLRWLAEYVSCPRPIDHGADGRNVWLRTAGLPGVSAVLGRWREHPAQVVPELGRALRRLCRSRPAGRR